MELTKGKAKGRVISNSIGRSFENATKVNVVLMKADVFRPKMTDTANEIENRLKNWKEKQSERHHSKVGF